MSQFAPGQDVKYRLFKAKIIACTMDARSPWYREKIGDVVTVQERQWYQDGKYDGSSYWVSTGKGMGFNASIKKQDVKEL